MKTEPAAPDFRNAISDPERFSRLLEYRLRLKAEIASCETELKELDAKITEQMTDDGAAKVQYGDSTVSLCQGRRSTLSKEALVQAGVPVSTIKQCSTETTYTYLSVR